MIPSLIEAWHVILNPVDVYMAGRVHMTINPIHVRCDSARDDIIDVIKPVL